MMSEVKNTIKDAIKVANVWASIADIMGAEGMTD